jgi:tetratricopeptide (TPR) repeat protein
MSTDSVVGLSARARELEDDAARYPDERGEILLEASEQWRRAGHYEQAAALLREVLTVGGEDAEFARCSLADIGFQQGADSEAWEHLRILEEIQQPGMEPAIMAAEMLEERGEYEAALRWFDRAIETVDAESLPQPGAMPSMAAMPLFGRQRCRTKLGLPVDELDRLADVAEDNRRQLTERLDRFAAGQHAAPDSRGSVVEMLVWQRAEQSAAAQRWPDVFIADVVGNHADIEQRLRELSADPKVTRISLVLGSVEGFAEYLRETGDDPAEESVRLAYAARARGHGRVISWPPGRNHACWCGSERKYKKCCGSPTTAERTHQ